MSVVADANFSRQACVLERLCHMFSLFLRVREVRAHLLSMVKEGAGHCYLVRQGVMGSEVQALVRVLFLNTVVDRDPSV